MSMLAFFPWLQLDGEVTIGNYRLVPYIRGKVPASAGTQLQATLDGILEPYLELSKHPIKHATLVQLGDGELIRDLNEDERTAVF